MIDGLRILAFIPARSGSKRLRDKNVRPFRGRSLIQRALLQARHARMVDHVALSTDSERYAREATAAGVELGGYLRPPELADDETPTCAAIADYLDWAKRERNADYTHVLLLQPTSPFRTPASIDAAIQAWKTEGRAPGFVSVRRVADKPSKVLVRDRRTGETWRYSDGDAGGTRELFCLTGELYLSPTELIREGEIWRPDFALLVRDVPDVLDIDTEADFLAAEALFGSSEVIDLATARGGMVACNEPNRR